MVTGQKEFLFDNAAEQLSMRSLLTDFPRRIASYNEGVSFGEIFRSICNETPATKSLIEQSLIELRNAKEIDVRGEFGEVRSRSSTIDDKDKLSIPSQFLLI